MGVDGQRLEAQVSVDIATKEILESVYSPSHNVIVQKRGDHKTTVQYENNQTTDKDFVLLHPGNGRTGSEPAEPQRVGRGRILLERDMASIPPCWTGYPMNIKVPRGMCALTRI